MNDSPQSRSTDVSRRRFLGYVLAGPTLVAAARWADASVLTDGLLGDSSAALTPIPSVPAPAEIYDLNDLLTDATKPTANLVTVTVNKDGTASFALPRAESGQGVTTSTAMIIAEELELPVDKVHITLADARPELVWNQFTAGSNTTISTFTPFRVAAAVAKGALLEAAAAELGGVSVSSLRVKDGVVTADDGRSIGYGDLAEKAASRTNREMTVALKSPSDFTVIGRPRNRIDALAAVTGHKQFAMDIDVPGAKPTMVCRPPTIKGTVKTVHNQADVAAMPGITDVAVISTGVAVRGETFGQCIDAVRELKVDWNPGTVDGQSDESILKQLKAAELPLTVPAADPLAKTVESSFTFYWKSNSALEPNTAVADVRADSAEIWSCLQSPIYAKEQVAQLLGMTPDAVTVHVLPGGGAFGRRMFNDVVLEAAEASQKFGKPVKLMWHRTDEFRAGRMHPMCTSRVRVNYVPGSVLSFEQRHTSVATDYTMGFGEILSSSVGTTPPAGLGNFAAYSQGVWELTTSVPYSFGETSQLLNEIDEWDTFHSGSVRNLYNADAVVARELVVDQVAAAMGHDPYSFRQAFLKNDRSRAVLDAVAKAGNWGRKMPTGTAQGIAFHSEYHGVVAALVEIDCRPQTVDRQVYDGVTGPRVTKLVMAVDVGLPVNPRGLQAQMMGGAMDGIGQILTESLHLRDGHFLEGSWDEYYYTRQWNSPPEMQIIVMPPTSSSPGGAGEFGVAVSKSATAGALARATGKLPTSFPINHNDDLGFEPLPTRPPIPQSPTDGLKYAY